MLLLTGFGFGLLFMFFLAPLSAVLIIVWAISRQRIVGKTLLIIWLSVFSFILVLYTIGLLTEKKNLDRADINGQYIIDRAKYPGKQADWQYNQFRFEITEDNKFLFHETDRARVITTYTGTVSIADGYRQPRVSIHGPLPRHHIIRENPTLYRTPFSFYYVFHSRKFGNVFFRKSAWKPIN